MMIAAFILTLALMDPDAAAADAPVLKADGVREEPRSHPHENMDQRIASRLDALKEAETDAEADMIADEVRSLWRQQAGPTADLLLRRARQARENGDAATVRRSHDHLRRLEPDFAEGWVVSAEYAAENGDWTFVLEALDQAVRIDPLRFDAWAMLGAALERAGAREAALDAYQQALLIHPRHPRAVQGRDRLERALAGRSL